jgi:hypothetical protein
MNKMNNSFFYINTLFNSTKFIKAFINNDYLYYATFNEFMVRVLKLSRRFIFYCWNYGTAIVQRQAQGYAVALRPGDVT